MNRIQCIEYSAQKQVIDLNAQYMMHRNNAYNAYNANTQKDIEYKCLEYKCFEYNEYKCKGNKCIEYKCIEYNTQNILQNTEEEKMSH